MGSPDPEIAENIVPQTSAKIYVSSLRLNQFRNYQNASLELDQRHVVLCGENGAGKTNLLEAISFLSPGRGMRRATYNDVAFVGGDGSWAVNAEIVGLEDQSMIGTGLILGPTGVESHRRIRINQTQVKSADELLDQCRVVWLTPGMDGLFAGSTSDRRRFLDRLVLAIDPAHGKRVSNYEKAMRARNRLLEDYSADPVWLDGIEGQLAEYGAAIATARTELVELLSSMIESGIKHQTPFPNAIIELDGVLEAEVGYGSALDLEDRYRDMLRSGRALDKAAGRTLIGPHRTDLLVTHGPKNMAAKLCSTGEQKALLVGIVLAHAILVEEICELSPILLLDEVAAHLDAKRRAALFDLLDSFGCQAWMTGTDIEMFSALEGRAQFLHVADGGVSQINLNQDSPLDQRTT